MKYEAYCERYYGILTDKNSDGTDIFDLAKVKKLPRAHQPDNIYIFHHININYGIVLHAAARIYIADSITKTKI